MTTDTIAQVPDIAAPLTEYIPDELRDSNWVTWGYDLRDGKPTKVPYQITGSHAKSTDPHTWTDFNKVVEHAADSYGFRGIGRVFGENDPYCGIDFDDCMDPAGGLKEWARPWLERLRKAGAYLEFSPSGNGIKAIVRATLPGRGRNTNVVEDGEKVGKLEAGLTQEPSEH